MYKKLYIGVVIFSIIQLVGIRAVYSGGSESNIYKSSVAQSRNETLNDDPSAFFQMSLDELLNQKITSVSRKPQKLIESPAAIFVITQEDIRRSGHTNIPELLRMVPGLQVARINGNQWAISSRGFNSRFANKLLVLIDGRSVYTPLFAGVYWDVQDTMLEDIDRIEVIRGPGATLWGANAVNGVINIITKSSKDTQGGLVTLGGGNEERGFIGLRYGGKISNNIYFRVYSKYFNRDDQADRFGDDALDEWENSQAGFRINMDISNADFLTIQGDYYKGDVSLWRGIPLELDEFDISGGNLLGRWEHIFSDTSDMSLQIYYDRTKRHDSSFGEDRDTFDIDFQHRAAPNLQHEIIWGLGYRYTKDDINASGTFILTPESRDDEIFSAFVQDEIRLIRDSLYMTIGSKFEHNDYSGFEFQPNARLSWTLQENHTLWAAISRAVRTPSRIDHDHKVEIAIPGMGPFVVVQGNKDFDSEELIAYELGYRVKPADRLSLDIAAFYNVYDDLQTTETDSKGSATFENNMDGETYGIEISVNWKINDYWKLIAGYTYLQTQFHLDRSSNSISSEEISEKKDPHNQVQIRSYLNLPHNLELDAALYYVDDVSLDNIPGYIRFDTRLGWRPTKDIDMSIVLQNAFDDQHPEWDIDNEIQRSLYGKVTWRL